MSMVQLVAKAKELAPAAMKAADKLADTAAGKKVLDLLKSGNTDVQMTGAEFMVRGGVPIGQVKDLLSQSRMFAVDVAAITKHLDETFAGQVGASSKGQTYAGGNSAVDNDFRRAEIKEAITILGVGTADNLMKLVVLFDWLKPEHITDYKSAGLIAPQLGYR